MDLSHLPATTSKSKKRIGRGRGSGKGGHTVGRGKSGQKSRGKVPLLFEGTKLKKSFLKRLPLLRGKGRFKSLKKSPVIVNIKFLSLFGKGEIVSVETLVGKGVIKKDNGERFGVKILGEGELTVPLKVMLPTSKGAKRKIEAAGGEVIIPEKEKKIKEESKIKVKKVTKPGKKQDTPAKKEDEPKT